MRKRLTVFVVILTALCESGCATRTTVVIDSQSTIVRLGSDVRGHVYTWNGKAWALSGPVNLPEGWYAGPLTGPHP